MTFSMCFLTVVFYLTDSYKKLFRRLTNFNVVSGLFVLFHSGPSHTRFFLGLQACLNPVNYGSFRKLNLWFSSFLMITIWETVVHLMTTLYATDLRVTSCEYKSQ